MLVAKVNVHSHLQSEVKLVRQGALYIVIM